MKEKTAEHYEVRFEPAGRSVKVQAGATLMDAAVLGGAWIDAPCGGEGKCGKCLVRAEGELAPPTAAELEHVKKEDLSKGIRLACQAEVVGDCTVESLSSVSWAEAKAGLLVESPPEVHLPSLDLEGYSRPALGIALDIGTTSLCLTCLDLETGRRVGISSADNPQALFGADIMTRIDRCMNDSGALEKMHHSVIDVLNRMITKATGEAGRSPEDVARLLLVGNTTMGYLVLGEDPSPLGTAPFKPRVFGPTLVDPERIGLRAGPGADLLVPKVIAGFLGTDIVSAVLALGITDSDEISLVVDLGTNGEIALGNRDRVLTCSTAAGPAFEGAQISAGMRAAPGAIESLSRDGNLEPKVLGGGEARGVCGSGLMDAVAALLESGIIMASGRILEPESAEAISPGRVRESGSVREFVLDPGTGVILTQKDIRQLQLAKGAVRAGIEILSEEMSLSWQEVERVCLAGAFGNFLKPSSAVKIGLFPGELEERITFAGNSALNGAELMLASELEWEKALRIAETAEVVELSNNPRFSDAFIEELSFPSLSHSTL